MADDELAWSFDDLMAEGADGVRDFHDTGRGGVLTAALDRFRLAAAAADTGERRAAALTNVSAVQQLLRDRGQGCEDLDEAVAAAREAVRLTASDSAERPGRLSNLDLALQARFDAVGTVRDLREAVRVSRAAASGLSPEDPRSARAWCNHMAALNLMFVYEGDIRHAHAAVRVGRRELALPQRDDAARVALSVNLAVAMLSVVEKTGDESMLDQCVTLLTGAIDMAHDSDARAALQSNLCLVLRTRFEYTAEQSDLVESIDVGYKALVDLPAGHPYVAATHGNLSLALHAWFRESGDLDVLRRAMAHGRTALAATPPGHADQAGRLSNLGIMLRSYIERTREPDAGREAVEYCRRALSVDGPFRTAAASTYALLLRTLSAFSDDERPLREAARLSQWVLAATDSHDRELAGRLVNHMIILRSLFERTGDRATLEQAVETGAAAISRLGADDAVAASVLSNFGRAASALAELDGNEEMSRQARHAYHRAARMSAASAMLRIWAYRAEADLATRHGDHGAAVVALEGAVALVPRVAGRQLDRRDREHELGRISGFVAQIAAVCVTANRPERAIELVEQVRGLLVGEAMEVQLVDVTALSRRARRLAAQFTRLVAWFRADVGRSTDPYDEGPADPNRSSQRARMDQEWNGLLERIRRMRGFARFLLPEPAAVACRHARHGPIVYAYAHELGCGLIVLRDDPANPAHAVELRSLRVDEVFQQADRLRSATAASASASGYAARATAHHEMTSVLEWLWDTYAEAALSAAGTPTRMWWCPIGVLTYLPLHAAGHHCDHSDRTVIDRVISSFTPTLSALAHARRPSNQTVASHEALVVCAPAPPLVSPLSGADVEAAAVTARLPGSLLLHGARARRETMLNALPGRSLLHLACHAVADAQYPAVSRVILTDHLTEPLTLRGLAGIGPHDGALCYLSACSTTEVTPRLADQAIHLTSAFQILGYRHVVGTLWPVNDRIATEAANCFYAALAADPNRLAVGESACHLRDAVRIIRDEMRSSPAHWAGYVHAGA